jgi:hypothetical protein
MYAKLYDNDGEVELEDLTVEGLHEGRYQAQRLLDELQEAIIKAEYEHDTGLEYAA